MVNRYDLVGDISHITKYPDNSDKITNIQDICSLPLDSQGRTTWGGELLQSAKKYDGFQYHDAGEGPPYNTSGRVFVCNQLIHQALFDLGFRIAGKEAAKWFHDGAPELFNQIYPEESPIMLRTLGEKVHNNTINLLSGDLLVSVAHMALFVEKYSQAPRLITYDACSTEDGSAHEVGFHRTGTHWALSSIVKIYRFAGRR